MKATNGTNRNVRGWGSAAKYAGMPVAAIRTMVRDGTLRARQEAGTYVFRPEDLRRIARQRAQAVVAATPENPPAPAAPPMDPGADLDGELAARLFQAFDDGRQPAEVVITQRVPPGIVEEAHRQWARLRDVLVLDADDREVLAAAAGADFANARVFVQVCAAALSGFCRPEEA